MWKRRLPGWQRSVRQAVSQFAEVVFWMQDFFDGRFVIGFESADVFYSFDQHVQVFDKKEIPAVRLHLNNIHKFKAIKAIFIQILLFLEPYLKTMVKAKNIHKSYGKLHVLKGVNLEVLKGEIVSIVGKSGAGKSTLLHILGTLDSFEQGELNINEVKVNLLKSKQLAQFRNINIGFIFQFHHLLPEFTAVENVCIPAFIKNDSTNGVVKRAKELLDYLGLSDRLEHKPSQLSGGEQQRVAVARALMNKPAVVFADEPSGNLDSESSKELHRLLFRLRDDFQQTFIIVTHNEELANMSDRTLVMKDGVLTS